MSSIVAYDLYKRYANPRATARQVRVRLLLTAHPPAHPCDGQGLHRHLRTHWRARPPVIMWIQFSVGTYCC